MAEIRLYRFEFLKNAVTDFVIGDVLEIFIETTQVVAASPLQFQGAGVKAYKNGTLITSGGWINTTPDNVAIQDFGAEFCVSTSLFVPAFWGVFPYAYYYTLENHWACAVNAETCDLIVVGTPDVVPATGPAEDDGSITVVASSSNTIEYNLGSDFTYGAGQSSGTFSNLIPGNYRVFIRDSKNCAINILVNVSFDSTYGTKYRLEYTDIAGFETRVDIGRRGYSGAITEICGSDNPFNILLRGEGSTDKFVPILTSNADVSLVSLTEQQFIELYTNDANLYRVLYYKDTGSGYDLKWTGKVLPFVYSEEYKHEPYYLTFTATDGLPELKDLYFYTNEGGKFFGTMKLIKLISYCLQQLKLDLGIRVACNMYSTGMNTTDADDPLDQAYADVELFYIDNNDVTLEHVLKSILDAFGARIIQWDNYWNIVRVEEMYASYDYREFDSFGDYVTNGSFSPVIDVDYPSADGVMFKSFPNFELQPGYGKLRVNYKLGLKDNILENGDFKLDVKFIPQLGFYSAGINTDNWTLVLSDYPLYSGYEMIEGSNVVWSISNDRDTMIVSQNAGNAYIQSRGYNLKMGTNNSLKITVRYNIKRSIVPGLLPTGINFPYIKLRVMVRYGSLYLTSGGNWSTTVNTVDFLVTKLNEYLEGEITADQPTTGTPVDGMNFDVRVYHATELYTQFKTKTALENFQTYDSGEFVIPNGYKTELRDTFTGSAITYDRMYYYELEETTIAASGYNIVEPADYHVTNNPRKWVLKYNRPIIPGSLETYKFNVDKVQVEFLTDGKEPIDTIIRVANAEPQNRRELVKDVIMGSSGDLITTEGSAFNYVDFMAFFKGFLPIDTPGLGVVTTNILSSEILYRGWLRNSSGVAYDFWTRDGIAESDRLHGILLRTYSFQYNRTWRLLRATMTSRNSIMGLLNSFREVNDNNRIYIPISVTLNDKDNEYSSELLELMYINTDDGVSGGSDGSGTSDFSGDFSIDFGSSFNT